MELTDLNNFHAAIRHGSFSEAARRTGTPKATLSRRIRRLEQTLGVCLFDRGRRELVLTDDGRLLQQRTTALLDELAAVGDEIATRTSRLRGRLRVSAPSLFAQEHLGRFAADFVRRFPSIELDIHVQDRFVDLASEGFDVVVRVNPDPDSLLVGRCLFTQPFVIAAAPSLECPPADRTEVTAVTLLGWPPADEWPFVRDGGRCTLLPRAALRFSSLIPLRNAVLAGAGVGVLPLSAVRDDLDRGELVAWGQLENRRAEIWVLYADTRPRNAKTAAFVLALANHLSASAS